jgi:hypothetical protein
MFDSIKLRIATFPFYRFNDVAFYLIASPLLYFAGIGERMFQWPVPIDDEVYVELYDIDD